MGGSPGYTEIIQENHYYPFGLNMTGPWDAPQWQPGNAYQYNGIEHLNDLGLNLSMAFFRSFDPAIGRWWQIDPIIKHQESLFAGFANNPVSFSDFLGADTTYQGQPLPTVTVTAKRESSNYDQSPVRYGFSGTFAQWQKAYGFEGWSFANAKNYWDQVYSDDFQEYAKEQDRIEQERIALQKLIYFLAHFKASGLLT
jgi:RHS repeat-associated protein